MQLEGKVENQTHRQTNRQRQRCRGGKRVKAKKRMRDGTHIYTET